MAIGGTFLLPAQPPGGPGGGSGDGIWQRNAYFGERDTFDACFGHQPGTGQYHRHVNPVCLRAQLSDNLVAVSTSRTGTTYQEKQSGLTVSPILGWSFDGYPIYGPYGYSDPKNASSAVKRIKSSFRVRSITARTSLPDWALGFHTNVSQQLTSSQYGPPINNTFPLGRYIEDYEYVAGLGDLDQYNGRFEVTPDYPNGVYAYHVTVNDDGTPAFPYILSGQYYGTVSGGTARTIPATAQDYFNSGTLTGQASTTDPLLAAWSLKNSKQNTRVVSGYDPSAGGATTWPTSLPAGVQYSGGSTVAVAADVQRVRTDATAVYMNSNGLPSYTIGPWFGAVMTGGVFQNWPSSQNVQVQLPRSPAAAAGTRTATGLGPVGVWVNGVVLFNGLDGGSYSNSAGSDVGGGLVRTISSHVSAASLEGGPLAAGSLVTAFAMFDATLATSTQTAASANWPVTLGGAIVMVKDSAGVQQQAVISYASPSQVNYRLPTGMATGFATVTITAGGNSVTGNINVAAAYPGLFKLNASGLAAAQVARLRNGQVVYDAVYSAASDGSLTSAPIAVGSAGEQATLVLYGTGLNNAANVSATIGGVSAQVSYAGPQGTYSGLDQINVAIRASVAGKGKVDVIITAAGKASNPVNVTFQ